MAQRQQAKSPQKSMGQYVIDQKLAQGGMAEIFLGRALDPQGLDRPVVIKRILPHISASPEFVDMLVHEAKLAVQLTHGNIGQVFDLGKVGDDYFIVMEYVDGVTLSRIARRLRQTGQLMPVEIALFIVSEIASGLDYMHRRTDSQGKPLNIVHRDISPQNIIVSNSGTAKIIDFGIAKASTHASITDPGVVKGKFAYMSPEHVGGDKLDARTDLFSLGVILWELLSNQRLFKGKNNKETINRVKRCNVPSVSGYRDDIPRPVQDIVKKTLAKNRKNRYASAHDMLLDIMRTIVQCYPTFAPKNLESFVAKLFATQEGEEPTILKLPMIDTAITKIDESTEDTLMAKPEILKLRLEELEAYTIDDPKTDQQADIKDTGPLNQAVAIDHDKDLSIIVPEKPHGLSKLLRTSLQKTLFWAGLLIGSVTLSIFLALHYAAETYQKTPPQQELARPVIVGNIKIVSTPPGATIYIDDRDSGHKTPAHLKELNVGTHKFGLYLKSHQYWEQETSIEKDDTARIFATMLVNTGALRIQSVPKGARVWIDGKERGYAPLMIRGLPPETVYHVLMTHKGFKDWEGSAETLPGKTSNIDAVLERMPFVYPPVN
jgi:serine/threonine protein kinase